jgi:hypothetical protein
MAAVPILFLGEWYKCRGDSGIARMIGVFFGRIVIRPYKMTDTVITPWGVFFIVTIISQWLQLKTK